jgi:hypothetical protein
MIVLSEGHARNISEAKLASMPASCNSDGVMPCAIR